MTKTVDGSNGSDCSADDLALIKEALAAVVAGLIPLDHNQRSRVIAAAKILLEIGQ
ncbi:MAG TPA: hypothetical protein PLY87_21720 [Planctomycetaceae bacterium]|nr:hypothetical protein [Planctomycetaceae bacterium]